MTPSATPDPPIPAARPPIPAARPPIPAARPPIPAAQPPAPAAQPPAPAAQPPVTPAPAAPAGPGLTAADPDPRPRARAMTGRSAWRAAIAALPTVPAAVAKPLRIVAVILVLAFSAAGGWLLAHSGGTAAPRHQATAPVTAPVHHAAESRTIKPAGAATFDPYGDGHGRGDQAIDASLSTAWHTAWYTTAAFGNLKPGTGLILDLGRPVTITGVKVTLGGRAGADVQVRTGTAATSLTDLQPVARVADAGGQVDLRLARPARGARYVLIWFTKLPPDATGTFQATVYNVSVEGS